MSIHIQTTFTFLAFFPTWSEFPTYHVSGEIESPIHSFHENPLEFIYKEILIKN